jgi:hypothetical protein
LLGVNVKGYLLASRASAKVLTGAVVLADGGGSLRRK